MGFLHHAFHKIKHSVHHAEHKVVHTVEKPKATFIKAEHKVQHIAKPISKVSVAVARSTKHGIITAGKDVSKAEHKASKGIIKAEKHVVKPISHESVTLARSVKNHIGKPVVKAAKAIAHVEKQAQHAISSVEKEIEHKISAPFVGIEHKLFGGPKPSTGHNSVDKSIEGDNNEPINVPVQSNSNTMMYVGAVAIGSYLLMKR